MFKLLKLGLGLLGILLISGMMYAQNLGDPIKLQVDASGSVVTVNPNPGVFVSTGNFNMMTSPGTITVSAYSVTNISVFVVGGAADFSISFLSGHVSIPDGVSYTTEPLPAPVKPCSIILNSLDQGATFYYSILGVQ
jgi:hypothetical protein